MFNVKCINHPWPESLIKIERFNIYRVSFFLSILVVLSLTDLKCWISQALTFRRNWKGKHSVRTEYMFHQIVISENCLQEIVCMFLLFYLFFKQNKVLYFRILIILKTYAINRLLFGLGTHFQHHLMYCIYVICIKHYITYPWKHLEKSFMFRNRPMGLSLLS